MKKKKFIKLPNNDGTFEIKEFPSNYESFIDIIKNKYKIDNIKDYEIKDAGINREINNKDEYELMSKCDEIRIKISINKKVRKIDNSENNSNSKPENKIEDNIIINEETNESNINIQTIKKEKEENSKIKISLNEIIKQLKYLDEESLNMLLEATQKEIIEKKINKIKEKY